MEFFSQTYTAIRGPAGVPQTAEETITKLADRLAQASSIADRRASVLALKGLARDMAADVGSIAMPALLAALPDAGVDADLGKALLDTLLVLCDAETGLRHADLVLADAQAVQTLFALVADQAFYTRFTALQLLSALLAHRRQAVQLHFLRASDASSLIAVLDEKREIIRNEALSVIQVLIAQSADIQKIFAFGGAFEKLLGIVTQEGGIEGTVVVQESLTCIDALLRFNVSNQNYFREIGLVPSLCPLFLFPANLPDNYPAPQEFALQFWDAQKAANARLVLNIVGMLATSKGASGGGDSSMVRFLVELALASNAPTELKMLALQHLPHHSPPLSLTLTPYVPVPETNGEEWDRLEPRPAIDVLVDLAVNGEYSGTMPGALDGVNLGIRSAAVSVFENYVRDEDVKVYILKQLAPDAAKSSSGGAATLLAGLASQPTSPLTRHTATRLHISTLLFASLVRSSPAAKTLARSIVPPAASAAAESSGAYFVPADASGPPQQQPPEDDDDDDEPQTLLQALAEHLSLALLARTRAHADEREAREWDRCVVGILCLLAQWLWDDPRAVKEVLEAGSLSTLVEPIGQDDVDAAVQGLCAFVLGILYEFDRESGEIPRTAIYPLIARLGADTLAARMARLREDERFRSAVPEGALSPYPRHVALAHDEAEMWFGWEFVEFWKSNYYSIQRGVHADPNAQRVADSANPEAATLIASLREVIQSQADELDALRKAGRSHKDEMQKQAAALEALSQAREEERGKLVAKIEALEEASRSRDDERDALQSQVASLAQELEDVQERRREQEKEHEDLLVFLEELSAKRKRDKDILRSAGHDVSEDEEEGGDDEDE